MKANETKAVEKMTRAELIAEPKPAPKFKVGDRVEMRGRYDTCMTVEDVRWSKAGKTYIVGGIDDHGRRRAGHEYTYELIPIPPAPAPFAMPKFKTGDKVTIPAGTLFTVDSCKWSDSAQSWAYYGADGEWFGYEDQLSPAPKFKVGDRVRVVGSGASANFFGRTGTITRIAPDSPEIVVKIDDGGMSGWSFHSKDLQFISTAPSSPAPFRMPELNVIGRTPGYIEQDEHAPTVTCSRIEWDAIAAELARRESDNARLAARVKELEGNVSSERAIDYRAIRKLTGLDDSAKVGDVMRRIEALAMAEVERDAARADVEKLRLEWHSIRSSFWSRNETFRYMLRRLLTEPGYAKEMMDHQLRVMFPDPPANPTIPDPTKEA